MISREKLLAVAPLLERLRKRQIARLEERIAKYQAVLDVLKAQEVAK
jgi:hypothetical protein